MTGSDQDVIVVGARCAGAPLAAMLAELGLRVLVLDKGDPATDTPSTHAIQPAGVRVLRDLGLADRLAALTDPITRIRFRAENLVSDSDDLLPVTQAPMLSLRRRVLDPVLVERAREAGAVVRTRTAVTDLLRDDSGRVVGVVAGGEALRAGLVVGADGVRSTVARLVGAEEYLRAPVRRAFVWAYTEGASSERDLAWIGRRGGHAFLSTPTDAGLTMTVVAPPGEHWPEFARDLDASYRRGLRDWPELADALAGARQVGGYQVTAHAHGFFRRSAGPGWVLVGDAGHFKDPTPGQGIADALRQSARLAPAVGQALDGDAEALTAWWHWRDRDALAMYWFAQRIGDDGPLPLVLQEMLAVLLSTDAGWADFSRVFDHTASPDRVFGPALLARAVRHGWARGRRRRLLSEAAGLARQGAREQVAGTRARLRR